MERLVRPRSMASAHTVSLYRGGKIIGEVSFPATDPRFVKDDGVFRLAYLEAKNRDDWDMFSVFAHGLIIFGDREGTRYSRDLTIAR
jgi:hypothetical protein